MRLDNGRFSECGNLDWSGRRGTDDLGVAFAPGLQVGPEYGMTVLSAAPAAARFALFVMSEPGQAILARHGLIPVALPAGENKP